jgi:hypothetical protein
MPLHRYNRLASRTYGRYMAHYTPVTQALHTEVYDRALSKALETGMDTFGFIAKVFLAQIIPEGVGIDDADYSKLYIIYGTDFTSRYIAFEASIKQYTVRILLASP